MGMSIAEIAGLSSAEVSRVVVGLGVQPLAWSAWVGQPEFVSC